MYRGNDRGRDEYGYVNDSNGDRIGGDNNLSAYGNIRQMMTYPGRQINSTVNEGIFQAPYGNFGLQRSGSQTGNQVNSSRNSRIIQRPPGYTEDEAQQNSTTTIQPPPNLPPLVPSFSGRTNMLNFDENQKIKMVDEEEEEEEEEEDSMNTSSQQNNGENDYLYINSMDDVKAAINVFRETDGQVKSLSIGDDLRVGPHDEKGFINFCRSLKAGLKNVNLMYHADSLTDDAEKNLLKEIARAAKNHRCSLIRHSDLDNYAAHCTDAYVTLLQQPDVFHEYEIDQYVLQGIRDYIEKKSSGGDDQNCLVNSTCNKITLVVDQDMQTDSSNLDWFLNVFPNLVDFTLRIKMEELPLNNYQQRIDMAEQKTKNIALTLINKVKSPILKFNLELDGLQEIANRTPELLIDISKKLSKCLEEHVKKGKYPCKKVEIKIYFQDGENRQERKFSLSTEKKSSLSNLSLLGKRKKESDSSEEKGKKRQKINDSKNSDGYIERNNGVTVKDNEMNNNLKQENSFLSNWSIC